MQERARRRPRTDFMQGEETVAAVEAENPALFDGEASRQRLHPRPDL